MAMTDVLLSLFIALYWIMGAIVACLFIDLFCAHGTDDDA